MMKSSRLVVLLMICVCLSYSQSYAQRKKQLAVLNFDFSTVDIGVADRVYGGRENVAIRISDKLITSLLGLGSCQVIERSQLEKVLYEQNLGVSGRIDPSTAAKVGRILGVDSLIIGNVAVFDLKGLPSSSTDTMWDPSDMSAHIAVNFRVINTTTAQIELSREVVGVFASPKKPSTASRFGKSVLGGFISGGSSRTRERVAPKQEDMRNVMQAAVDEAVNKIAAEIDVYIAKGATKDDIPALDAVISGRITAIDGPSVVIEDVKRSLVRKGDRLFVRRPRVSKNPQTGKETKYTIQIGEVEVVEIQEEVVIGSFSGSGTPQINDIVTNSVGGTSSAGGTRSPK